MNMRPKTSEVDSTSLGMALASLTALGIAVGASLETERSEEGLVLVKGTSVGKAVGSVLGKGLGSLVGLALGDTRGVLSSA